MDLIQAKNHPLFWGDVVAKSLVGIYIYLKNLLFELNASGTFLKIKLFQRGRHDVPSWWCKAIILSPSDDSGSTKKSRMFSKMGGIQSEPQ
jgi:hypothetical protein